MLKSGASHIDHRDHVAVDGSPPRPAHPAEHCVWRSVWAHGDAKTEKSRHALQLPVMAVTALRPLSWPSTRSAGHSLDALVRAAARGLRRAGRQACEASVVKSFRFT